MTNFRTLALTATVALGLGALAMGALAQSNKPMGGMDHGGGPAMGEYMMSMQKMQSSMQMKSSGDADIDFVRMMIPHHQAAVDMAKTELKYGKDPEIRKLAEDVIAAQNKEIAQMNAWLAKHDKK